MRLLLAFLRRDWLIRSSYRASWAIGIGHLLFSMAAFFFIGRLIDQRGSASLAGYGGAYFPFVLFGLLVSRVLSVSISSVAGNLRQEQLQGTLEAMLVTPLSLPGLVVGAMLWDLLMALAEVFLALIAAYWIFGVDLMRANLAACAAVSLLTVLCFSGIGVLSASSVLLFGDFDPASWVMDGLMKLASGVFVPLMVLPGWLQALARWLPMTYGLEGVRQAMLMGRSLRELSGVCAILAAFSVVLWPLSLMSLAYVLRRLKQSGRLSFR